MEPALRGVGFALVGLGVVIAVVGVLLLLAGGAASAFRLPGDVVIRGQRWVLVLPIATSILLSLLLTVLLNVLLRR